MFFKTLFSLLQENDKYWQDDNFKHGFMRGVPYFVILIGLPCLLIAFFVGLINLFAGRIEDGVFIICTTFFAFGSIYYLVKTANRIVK